MTLSDIVRHRLANQQIAETKFTKPTEIISWMGAMQAQEFAMAKWAIGLRLPDDKQGLPDLTDAAIEKAFNNGDILRTHLLRPTWHFVGPADIRWLLALTGPRINAANAFMYRKSDLNDNILNRCNDILVKTLEGGKHLTRTELKAALEQTNIFGDGLRLSYIMMHAELCGIICSGPRKGNQFTYALLNERVPATRPVDREEALAKLGRRYFSSRGPATVHDLAYWSGITLKEARESAATLGSEFAHEVLNGKEYIFLPAVFSKNDKCQTTFLMPDYDEYGMSYKDRSALVSPEYLSGKFRKRTPKYNRMIVLDGHIAGSWHRTIRSNKAIIELAPFYEFNKKEQQQIRQAAKRYSSFIGKELSID